MVETTSTRFYKQRVCVVSLDDLTRIHDALDRAATEALAAQESAWREREDDVKAAHFSYYKDVDGEYAQRYWEDKVERNRVERVGSTTLAVEAWDLRRENSVSGSFEEVVRHFAPSNIGKISFIMRPVGFRSSAHSIELELDRARGVRLELTSDSHSWADGHLYAVRALLEKSQPWYRFSVRGGWLEVALTLPVLLGAVLLGAHASSDDNRGLLIVAIVVGMLSFWALPVFGMTLRERIPRFETYAVGETTRTRGVLTGIGFGLSLAVTIGLGLIPVFT